jgi:hypothetical protein
MSKPVAIKSCKACNQQRAVFDKIKHCYQDYCYDCKCTATGCLERAIDDHRLCKTHRSCITVKKCKKCDCPCGTGMYCKACYAVVPMCAKKDCKLKVCFDSDSKSCFRFCQHHKCKTLGCVEQCDNGVCDVCVVKSVTIGVCKSCEGPTGTYKDPNGVIQKYKYCVECC